MSGVAFVGRLVEWTCRRCHYVVQSHRAPEPGEEHCSGCKAILALAETTLSLTDLVTERTRLTQENARLARQVAELEDEVAALRPSGAA